MVTVQVVAMPEHAPLQPPKPPDVMFAVNVTTVPCGNDALHVAGQLIPEGVLVTVPVPGPEMVTLSASDGTFEKVAATV
ncbi:MAG TPA: hypothetical protein VE994_07800 [Terriglobales bacterium]|nr:hypothetical protein [Terriglobales bacterium]